MRSRDDDAAVDVDADVGADAAVDGDDGRNARFLALTRAGKPAWDSRGVSSESVTLCAAVQALAANAEAQGGGELEGVDYAGRALGCASTSTMIYVASSAEGESVGVLRKKLKYVEDVMTSCVTNAALVGALGKNTRFDVRRAMAVATLADERLHELATRGLRRDTAYVFDTYRTVGMSHEARRSATRAMGDALRLVTKPFAGVAFGIGDGRLVTYVKPRGHRPQTISARDVMVLMNYARATSRSGESMKKEGEDEGDATHAESFGRVCLPEFNPDGFMHAYVSYIEAKSGDTEAREGDEEKNDAVASSSTSRERVGVCFLTASADALEECRAARDALEKRLNADDTLTTIARAARRQLRVSDVPEDVLGRYQVEHDEPLLHFVYNRPARQQHVSSAFASSVSDDRSIETITRAYAMMYENMTELDGTVDATTKPPIEHSAQRVRYERRKRHSVLACVGGDFEIYLTFKPSATVTVAVAMCNRLCVWLRVSEPELFLENVV